MSHYDTNVTEKENVTFLTDMPLRAVNELKSSSETDIQVIGGGKFITSLIEAVPVEWNNAVYRSG